MYRKKPVLQTFHYSFERVAELADNIQGRRGGGPAKIINKNALINSIAQGRQKLTVFIA